MSHLVMPMAYSRPGSATRAQPGLSSDDSRVLANLRSNKKARIMLRRMPKQRLQMLKRKLADWQNLLRLAAFHAPSEIDIVLSMGTSGQWKVPKQDSGRRQTEGTSPVSTPRISNS